MKLLKKTILFLSLTSMPNLSHSQEVNLTCPNSGKGTPSLILNLTALGGFELENEQKMFLPLQFDHAKMETGDPQKGVKLSCIYNSFTEKDTAQKTVTLVAYTSPGTTNCSPGASNKGGKVNQLVCKGSK